MQAVVLTIHMLLALTLIGVVLLQRSEGGGLGIGGGGGIMTSRGAATALSKVTWAVGIAFLISSLTLTVLAARDSSGGSVIDRAGVPAPAAPASPVPGLDGDLLPPKPAAPAPETSAASGPAATAPAATVPGTAPAAEAPAATPAPAAPANEGPAAPPPVK